jgi:hypothetical protein
LIYQFRSLDLATPFDESAQGSRLAEEGVHLPKLLLLPIIERVVVTLRALNLQSQENASGGGRRQRSVFVIHFHDQKVHGAVEIFRARRR